MQKLRLQWKPLSQPIKNTKDDSILLSAKLETNIYSRRFFILRFNEGKLVREYYFFAFKMYIIWKIKYQKHLKTDLLRKFSRRRGSREPREKFSHAEKFGF